MAPRSVRFSPLLLLAALASGQVLETGSQPELSLIYLTSHVSPPACHFRLPPFFQNPPYSPPSWEPTPADWWLGTWYFSATNQATYLEFFADLQWTLSRIGSPSNTAPTEQLYDLTTGFLKGTSTLVYEYGVDTPVAPDAYAYQPTGPLAFANNSWAVLAWGYDTHLVPYGVVYETRSSGETSESIDFISRSSAGVAPATFEFLKAAIRDLRNTQLSALLQNVTLTPQDGRRNGQPYPSCNATCMQNAYALT